jgi:hypothetical protein
MAIFGTRRLECPDCGKPSTATITEVAPTEEGGKTTRRVGRFDCPGGCAPDDARVMRALGL